VPDAFVIDDNFTIAVGVDRVACGGVLGKAHAATIRRRFAGDKIGMGILARANSQLSLDGYGNQSYRLLSRRPAKFC
jgi:hypothetical protein